MQPVVDDARQLSILNEGDFVDVLLVAGAYLKIFIQVYEVSRQLLVDETFIDIFIIILERNKIWVCIRQIIEHAGLPTSLIHPACRLNIFHVDLQVLEALQMLFILHAARHAVHGAIHQLDLGLVHLRVGLTPALKQRRRSSVHYFDIVAAVELIHLRLQVERHIRVVAVHTALFHNLLHFRRHVTL